MPPFVWHRHPVQVIRRFWTRLLPDSYLLTLIMWSIRSLCYPLNPILPCNLQNLSLLIVFVSCCFCCITSPYSCFRLVFYVCQSALTDPKSKATVAPAVDSIFFIDCLLQHELRLSTHATKPSMPSTVWTSR